jgi:hypothetical protein
MAGVSLALAFSGIACIALAGRRLSVWRLTVSVALSQFLFHTLFGLGHGTGTGTAGVGHSHLMHHIDIGTLVGPGAGHTHSMLPTDSWMWAGHATAALVTIAALRYGELAFWSLYRIARIGLARLMVAPALVPLDTAQASPAAAHGERVVRDLGILIGRMRHRGPPSVLAFA